MSFSARPGTLVTIATLIVLTFSIKIKQLHQSSSDASFVICPETLVFDPKVMRCVCPSDRPFTNLTGECVRCEAPAVWNPTT